eukprot:TRINITY_DN3808_c0_g3_i1.p1 TRINITY_DN3808_c0_g3~~TRINITY_DN3808_c0_g3_i1.p1  ORF type:complete len:177 (-),score=37.59 TRINITY_DN3808_c0_g3_i1:91-621(-)
MHRDIKPQNLLYDIEKKIMRVIDWGLADFYFPHRKYSTRVAARFYKAPELLLANPHYDYSVDVWSLGCIFAAVLFQTEVFFAGKSDADQLLCIAKVLGTEEVYEYVAKNELREGAKMCKEIGKFAKKPWEKFRDATNEAYTNDEAIDLLQKMLVIDHTKRIAAKDALAHPYFEDVA